MFSAIIIILSLPFTDLSRFRGMQFNYYSITTFYFFLANFLILMILGAKHVESPFIQFGQLSAIIYFLYFSAIPLVCIIENTLVYLKDFTGIDSKLISITSNMVFEITCFSLNRSFSSSAKVRMDNPEDIDPTSDYESDYASGESTFSDETTDSSKYIQPSTNPNEGTPNDQLSEDQINSRLQNIEEDLDKQEDRQKVLHYRLGNIEKHESITDNEVTRLKKLYHEDATYNNKMEDLVEERDGLHEELKNRADARINENNENNENNNENNENNK